MTKAKGKAKSRVGKGTSSVTASGKQVDMDALRQKIATYVGGRALPMLKTTTEEVVKVGNLSSLKYLFELIGLHPACGNPDAKAEAQDSDDLAAKLLAEIFPNNSSGGEDAEEDEARATVGSDSVE